MTVMMKEPKEKQSETGSAVVRITVTGKLSQEDYQLFVTEIEALVGEHGKIRVLVELVVFLGWTLSAIWEDAKFAARHFNDIERLAIVGDRPWEKGMAVFCKRFTRAVVCYFDISALDEARQWIAEG